MNSFIACAKAAAVTIFVAYTAFKVFAGVWLWAFESEEHGVAWNMILWLDHGTTALIAILCGFLGARFDRSHPVATAVVAAILVELLHVSIGGGLRDQPLQGFVSTLVAALLAAAIAWWKSGLRAGQEAAQ
jgi:hypothetical protein